MSTRIGREERQVEKTEGHPCARRRGAQEGDNEFVGGTRQETRDKKKLAGSKRPGGRKQETREKRYEVRRSRRRGDISRACPRACPRAEEKTESMMEGEARGRIR
jgi:hypothetical protein